MSTTMPLTGSKPTLHALADLYLLSFWALFATFAITAIQAGYDAPLAVISCTFGAIACLLIRLEHKLDQPATAAATPTLILVPDPPIDPQLLASGQLQIQVDELLSRARADDSQVGLMLIRVEGEPATSLLRVLRQVLAEAASRILEVDSQTIAVLDRRPEVALYLNRLARDLQSHSRDWRLGWPAGRRASIVLGVSVAEESSTSSAALLIAARSAIRLAEAQGRDTFIRRI